MDISYLMHSNGKDSGSSFIALHTWLSFFSINLMFPRHLLNQGSIDTKYTYWVNVLWRLVKRFGAERNMLLILQVKLERKKTAFHGFAHLKLEIKYRKFCQPIVPSYQSLQWLISQTHCRIYSIDLVGFLSLHFPPFLT